MIAPTYQLIGIADSLIRPHLNHGDIGMWQQSAACAGEYNGCDSTEQTNSCHTNTNKTAHHE